MPVGSVVTISGKSGTWPVGNGGLIFIDLDNNDPVQLSVEVAQKERGERKRCSARISANPGSEKTITRLGEVTCH